jgi:hypothetical protein
MHQFMVGVPCPDSSARIKQTSKQLFVQRCGFTSVRKTAPTAWTSPPPPKPVNVDFKNTCDENPTAKEQQNMWNRRRRSFCANRANFGAVLKRAPPESRYGRHKSQKSSQSPVNLVVYYESKKRKLKKRRKNEYRCDERLKTKAEESTCLTCTGLYEELEHLKTETRLIRAKIVNVMGEYVI